MVSSLDRIGCIVSTLYLLRRIEMDSADSLR